jgi:prephenate dehydratase
LSSHTKISYQGEPGAFSEQASKAYFGKACNAIARETFNEIFEDVEQRRSAFSIVPIENSLHGSVHQNFDLLWKHRVWIVGEVKLRIKMNLLALPGVTIKDLSAVYSHPQALGQCEKFLRSLKHVTVNPFYDTAGAAKMIAQERRQDAAAIASLQAAAHYGLNILRSGIENDHRNFTRFLIIGKKPAKPKKKAKTSLIFATKNIPGALFKCLSVFALRNINLLKIESRPIIGAPWEYLFYLDIEGDARENEFVNALNHLQELTSYFKNLGSYETGKIVTPK